MQRLRYGPLLVAGAVPLGAELRPHLHAAADDGGWAVASVLVAHLLFRTAYAGVNVPYLAMTARISPDAGDRAFVAGMRMLFGTAAAVVVALVHGPVGRWLTGSSAAASLFRRGDPVRRRRSRDPDAGRRDLSRGTRSRPAAAGAASEPRCSASRATARSSRSTRR